MAGWVRSICVKRATAILFGLLVAGCDGRDTDKVWLGYAEGDRVVAAATGPGWITALPVVKGQSIKTGDLLFQLDDTREKATVEQAQARAIEARARLENLLIGLRPEEIAALEAQLADAEAARSFAEREFRRQSELQRSVAGNRRQLEQAESAVSSARAHVAEIQARIAVGRLPARADEIAAARAVVVQSDAALAEASWQLDQRRIQARVAGRVELLPHQPGEYVLAGAPVVALLPPENIHVRIFVPEAARATLKIGDQLALSCDGCPPDMVGQIDFIATEAEFTPPVIYSLEARQKLVWQVRLTPPTGHRLLPGQPVQARRKLS